MDVSVGGVEDDYVSSPKHKGCASYFGPFSCVGFQLRFCFFGFVFCKDCPNPQSSHTSRAGRIKQKSTQRLAQYLGSRTEKVHMYGVHPCMCTPRISWKCLGWTSLQKKQFICQIAENTRSACTQSPNGFKVNS